MAIKATPPELAPIMLAPPELPVLVPPDIGLAMPRPGTAMPEDVKT